MGLIITKNTVRTGIKKAEEMMNKNVLDALIGAEKLAKISIAKKTPIDTTRLVNSVKAESGRTVTKGKMSKRLKQNLPAGKDVVRFVEMDEKKASLVFGTNVPYSKFVEFGTSRQKANPFFSDGLKDAIPAIKKSTKEKLTIK
jgi:HK97 gp10 family phage protein